MVQQATTLNMASYKFIADWETTIIAITWYSFTTERRRSSKLSIRIFISERTHFSMCYLRLFNVD